MALEIERHLFTIGEYMTMIKSGVFEPDDRIELIKGEIVEMPPIGDEHAFSLTNLVMLFARRVSESAIISVQNPLLITHNNSRPQPDIALLKTRSDLSPKSPPTSQDVLLLIEVSDTTVKYDRGTKMKLYAEADIPVYWIVDIQKAIIEVYSNPSGGEYKQVRQAKRGETLALPSGLEGVINVDDVLG